MIWIEVDGQRTDVASLSEARQMIETKFPDAELLAPFHLGHQRITHVRDQTVQAVSDFALMPVAVIVEEGFSA